MKKYGFYKLSPLRGLALMLIVIAALCATGLAELGAEPNSAPQAALPDDADFKAELNKWGRKGTAGIFVVAPASGLKGDEAKRAYAMAEKLGVRFSEKTLSPDATPYNANSDKIRLELLAEALTSPDVEVVWALRGGYGSSRLLAELALKMPPQAAEKTFIGYSDMTFLHLFLQSKGWRTIHGAMFWDLDSQTKDEENFRLLAGLLAGRIEKLDYSGLKPFNQAAAKTSKPIEGLAVGGNLTCLAAAAGTPWALEPEGKILFLEDVGEAGYKIDRLLTHLKLSGGLKGVRAVILGEFSQGDSFTNYALERFAAGCDIPVFKTDFFGHGRKNYPLIFNAPATVRQTPGNKNEYSLSIQTGRN